MALTRVSPALFQVSNNITSVTVGGSANTISLTFDSNGVITGASNNAVSVANTAITGNIISSQITSVANTQLTGLIQAAQIGSANASLITSGTLPGARLPTGSVLQVVQGTFQSITTTTSNTAVATGLTATITPTSATSKILVTVFGSLQLVSSGTTNIYPLFKNGASLNSTFMIWSQAVGDGVALSASYLDSPATTSATTYALYFRTEQSGYTASFGSDTSAGAYLNSITLMEIAA